MTPIRLRYVLELRSLVNLYVNPLLHPLLSPPSSPIPSCPPTPYTNSAPSSSELPIAARFLRSIQPNNNSEDSLVRPPSNAGWHPDMPEIDGSDESLTNSNGNSNRGASSRTSGKPNARSHNSLPVLPRDAPPFFPSSASYATLPAPDPAKEPKSSRLGFPFRTRHPLRPAASSSKLHKSSSRAPAEVLQPPVLPEALKSALEATVEMLRGHEELSAKL